MNKLTLRLDDLRVDTFHVDSAPKQKGTVFGEQCTCYTQCTCPGCPTCDASCNGSCDATCNESCEGTCEQSCRGTCFATCDFNCGPSEGGYSCATSPYPNQPCFPC
jgi:hypothetical protein